MDRMAAKAGLALAALMLLWGAEALCADPGAPRDRGGAAIPGKGAGYRLDEVRIAGSSERPAILFFLPRARFRLLPPRKPDLDVKIRLLMDDKTLRATE